MLYTMQYNNQMKLNVTLEISVILIRGRATKKKYIDHDKIIMMRTILMLIMKVKIMTIIRTKTRATNVRFYICLSVLIIVDDLV